MNLGQNNAVHMSDLPRPEIEVDFTKFTPNGFFDFMTEVRQSLYSAKRVDLWESLADKLHDASDANEARKILVKYIDLI